jgi:hypothetical protein
MLQNVQTSLDYLRYRKVSLLLIGLHRINFVFLRKLLMLFSKIYDDARLIEHLINERQLIVFLKRFNVSMKIYNNFYILLITLSDQTG